MNIINPINNQSYDISSKEGTSILRSYIQHYNNLEGGNILGNVHVWNARADQIKDYCNNRKQNIKALQERIDVLNNIKTTFGNNFQFSNEVERYEQIIDNYFKTLTFTFNHEVKDYKRLTGLKAGMGIEGVANQVLNDVVGFKNTLHKRLKKKLETTKFVVPLKIKQTYSVFINGPVLQKFNEQAKSILYSIIDNWTKLLTNARTAQNDVQNALNKRIQTLKDKGKITNTNYTCNLNDPINNMNPILRT